MCNTAMNIIRIINPKRTTWTQVIFWLFEQATHGIYKLKKKKEKNRKQNKEHISQLCSEQLRFMLLSTEESYQKAHREMQHVN